MYIAAMYGHVECIDALARYGVDVNRAKQVRERRPLVMGRSRASQGFRADGCDAKQNGATPTYIAAQEGHMECIDALVRHGADVNQAKQVSA